MKLLDKIKNMFGRMRTIQKVYAALWAATGAVMIALIAVLVGISPTSKETLPGHWTYSIDWEKYATTSSPDKPANPEDYAAVIVNLKKDQKPTPDHPQTSNLQAVGTIENAPQLYEVTSLANRAIYGFKEWDAKPTAAALSAQNAIAAVAAVFAVSLVGSVFTTVIGEYLIRRNKRQVANQAAPKEAKNV